MLQRSFLLFYWFFSGILLGLVNSQCNETMNVTADIKPRYVTSPGYDDDRLYSGNLTCRWQIKAKPGTSLVFSLTISHISCFLGDHVKLFLDNETEELNNGNFCGRGKSFGPLSFGDSSVLVVEFVSKPSNIMSMSKQGFRLQFLSSTDLSANGCQGKQVLMSDDTSQYISSPNFPYQYPSNADCEWEIRAPAGYDVNVKIMFIDIENEMLCSFDSLKFQEGSTLNTNSLCSENNFNFGNVRGSNFTVSFRSDDSENKHGFLLSYRSTEATQKNCSLSRADIVFLLDSSGSVGETNFAFLTSFISDLISDFNIGPDAIQVSLVTYETNVTNHYDLNQYATKEDLINATNQVSYNGGWTNTDKGLNHTLTYSFTEEHGARPNTTRVLLVFSDGVSNYPLSTRAIAQEVKNAGITVISVGVGSGVDSPELFAISSLEEYVFRATSFTDLDTIKYSLENIICKIISSLPPLFIQTTVLIPIIASPLLGSSSTNQEPSTTESLSSTIEASTSEYSTSSITSSNQISTLGASSTIPSNQISTLGASSTTSSNQISTLGASSTTPSNQISTIGVLSTTSSNHMLTTSELTSIFSTSQTSTTESGTTTKEEITNDLTSSVSLTSTGTVPGDQTFTPESGSTTEEITDGFTSPVSLTSTGAVTDDASVSSTTKQSLATQQTSSTTQSTEGFATDLFGEFVLTRDTIAIISVCTVFVFLSTISCCLLICLCIARWRKKKRGTEKMKLHRDLEKNDSKQVPVVHTRANCMIHLHYHGRYY